MINDSSLAAGVGISANNTPFTTAAVNVPRKVLVIASPLSANEGNFTDGVKEIVTSVEYHANKAGRGSAAAKMLQWVREVYSGELWFMPAFEPGTPTQSTGDITFAGTATAAGTIHLYIGGDKVKNISVDIGDDAEAVVDKCVTQITADADLPVSGVKNGVTAEQLDLTAKSAGPWGDFVISVNLGFQEALPAGITVASTTQMSSGAGIVTLATYLDYLGLDDDSNEDFFTAILHINGQDSTSLNSLSTWNGIGNEISGNWSKSVHRPTRSLVGDTADGSAGLAALITLGNGRKESDRTSGCVAAPASPNSPHEIAAKTIGIMEELAAQRPEENYVGKTLPGVYPGVAADRWTASYDSRDSATQAGITATRVKGGAVQLSNVITFYHSASVSVASNGYREMRNIAVLQNMLYSLANEFESSKWQGCTIVADIAKVSNAVNRQKVRSTESVRAALNSLADQFEAKAWIYSSEFTKNLLKESGYIAIRTLSDGFNIVFPCQLSGVLNIIDLQLAFDTNIAA